MDLQHGARPRTAAPTYRGIRSMTPAPASSICPSHSGERRAGTRRVVGCGGARHTGGGGGVGAHHRVASEGFEPPKSMTADLQSDPFGRLGNSPGAPDRVSHTTGSITRIPAGCPLRKSSTTCVGGGKPMVRPAVVDKLAAWQILRLISSAK